jgi:hypothetical protein
MLDQLLSKLQNTSDQTIRDWWGPEISNEFPDIIDSLEWDSNGCYQIGTDHIIYHNFTDGRIQKLVKNYDKNSWHLYQRLYLKAAYTKSVRVTLPIKRDIVEINGESWEFTDAMRPGNYNGETMKKELVVNSDDDIAYIANQYYNLFQLLIEVSNEENSKIPFVSFNHMHFDDVGCYFTLDSAEWKISPSESIQRLLELIDSVPSLIGTTEQQFTKFRNLMKEKLGSFL